MPGKRWAGKKRRQFLYSYLPGYIKAQNNDNTANYLNDVLLNYFVNFSKDLEVDPSKKSLLRVGRAKREKQIRFWFNNHSAKSRVEREVELAKLPFNPLSEDNDTSDTDVRTARKRKVKREKKQRTSKLETALTKMNVVQIFTLLIQGVLGYSRYTTPDFQLYQRYFWDQIKAAIKKAYKKEKRACRKRGVEPPTPLEFQNAEARRMLAHESDDVRAFIAKEMLKQASDMERAEGESELEFADRKRKFQEERREEAKREIGDLLSTFLEVINLEIGYMGVIYLAGEDPDNKGHLKSIYVEHTGRNRSKRKFSKTYSLWEGNVRRPFVNWAIDCFDWKLREPSGPTGSVVIDADAKATVTDNVTQQPILSPDSPAEASSSKVKRERCVPRQKFWTSPAVIDVDSIPTPAHAGPSSSRYRSVSVISISTDSESESDTGKGKRPVVIKSKKTIKLNAGKGKGRATSSKYDVKPLSMSPSPGADLFSTLPTKKRPKSIADALSLNSLSKVIPAPLLTFDNPKPASSYAELKTPMGSYKRPRPPLPVVEKSRRLTEDQLKRFISNSLSKPASKANVGSSSGVTVASSSKVSPSKATTASSSKATRAFLTVSSSDSDDDDIFELPPIATSTIKKRAAPSLSLAEAKSEVDDSSSESSEENVGEEGERAGEGLFRKSILGDTSEKGNDGSSTVQGGKGKSVANIIHYSPSTIPKHPTTSPSPKRTTLPQISTTTTALRTSNIADKPVVPRLSLSKSVASSSTPTNDKAEEPRLSFWDSLASTSLPTTDKAVEPRHSVASSSTPNTVKAVEPRLSLSTALASSSTPSTDKAVVPRLSLSMALPSSWRTSTYKAVEPKLSLSKSVASSSTPTKDKAVEPRLSLSTSLASSSTTTTSKDAESTTLSNIETGTFSKSARIIMASLERIDEGGTSAQSRIIERETVGGPGVVRQHETVDISSENRREEDVAVDTIPIDGTSTSTGLPGTSEGGRSLDTMQFPKHFLGPLEFLRRLLGDDYESVVERWIELELLKDFPEGNKKINYSKRPKPIGKWNKGNRSFKKMPDIKDFDSYVSTMYDWWISLQPLWRIEEVENAPQEGEKDKAKEDEVEYTILTDELPTEDEDWRSLAVGGRFGFQTVLLGMAFWLMDGRREPYMELFGEMMKDIERVLNWMVGSIRATQEDTKRTITEDSTNEDESERSRKRRRL